MSRKRPGWRAAERLHKHISRELARLAAESVKAEREQMAIQVCPDGLECKDPACIAARKVFMSGGDWRQAMAAIKDHR